ncbi:hypothetical protein K474DRAFT_1665334 [Panus rudis PR-1116 ss-1]|nr:hypothetical protein K474DRAFT_1665334 [Panus rudis PR-1116 ss-1]
MSHKVHIEFAGTLLASKKGKPQQQSYLDDVAKFIQAADHAKEAKDKSAETVVIHDAKHESKSYNKKPHSSIALYDHSGNLVLGAHVDANDPTKGEVFVPADPNYVAKWGTLAKANPGAGKQLDKEVDI